MVIKLTKDEINAILLDRLVEKGVLSKEDILSVETKFDSFDKYAVTIETKPIDKKED